MRSNDFIKWSPMIAVIIFIAALSTVVLAVQTATRIRFAKGKSSATMTSEVGRYGKKDYILGAKKGQELTASVSSECESVTLDVIDKGNGQSLTDPTTEFRDELPGTDDYIIRVQNSDLPSCGFTLTVAIK